MVTQGAHQYAGNATNSTNNTDRDSMVEFFRDNVKWFAIYSSILGLVMLVGTYLAIMLFNVAAHSQVSSRCTLNFRLVCKMKIFKRFSEYEASISKLFSIRIYRGMI